MGRPRKITATSIAELQKLFQKEFRENRKIFQSIKKQLQIDHNKDEKTLQNCFETLQNICRVNEEIEATICNVMIAIKQNSFLQAWYPEQQGINEGLFSGPHPIVQERIKKKYASGNPD